MLVSEDEIIFSENNSDEELNQLANSVDDDNPEEEDEDCLGIDFCNCDSCTKQINVLTNHQANTLIGILDKMENSESKQAFMRQIKDIIDDNDFKKDDIYKVEFKDVILIFFVNQKYHPRATAKINPLEVTCNIPN
ncbi:hypothetical protein QL285_085889 [Trifolium repens]|nr:hypothetical protein QL285_085889 [Trifolium repens]